MILLAGDSDAELPPEPDDDMAHVVVAGSSAVFVAGRVQYDAPTLIRVGEAEGTERLTLAHTGVLATPDHRLQIIDMDLETLGEIPVRAEATPIEIYVSDLSEPDEILVVVS